MCDYDCVQTRAEAELRVAKLEAFELKSAESMRTNSVQRDGSAKESLQAVIKAHAAELSKASCV